MKKKILVLFMSFILISLICVGCNKQVEDSDYTPINHANPSDKLVAYKGIQQENELTFANAINVDNEYFFYYFYLGTISDVPLYTSIALQYRFDTEVTFNFSKVTSESVSRNISKSKSTIDTHSYTGGFKIGFNQQITAEAGMFLAKAKTSLSATEETDHHWTNNWGSTITDIESATSTYLSQYSSGYEEKIKFSESVGFIKDYYYRMAIYNTVNAYGVLAYEVKTNTYSATNDFFLEENSIVRLWEESVDPTFVYEQNKDLAFDVNQAIAYAESHKLNIEPTENDTLKAATYYVSTTPLSCKLDNKYNYNQPDPNGNNYHYSHDFNFGDFVIHGCAKDNNSKNTFILVKNSPAELSFRLEYDADNLPVQDSMKSRYVSIDTRQSGFYNLPWNVGERDVKKGMVVILIEYNDGSPSDKVCITNAFDGKKGGESIMISNNLTRPCKISIAICYELVQWAPGFLGIVDDYWMNWRINQVFNFK